jgi:hypothetical protein
MRCVEGDGVRLHGYSDSDWEGSAADRKSTSSGCFSLGSLVVSWFSKKQTFVTPNSVEVEYMESILASCEAIWLHKLLANLFG